MQKKDIKKNSIYLLILLLIFLFYLFLNLSNGNPSKVSDLIDKDDLGTLNEISVFFRNEDNLLFEGKYYKTDKEIDLNIFIKDI